MVKNETLSFGDKTYIFGSDGVGISGWSYANYRFNNGVLTILNSKGNVVDSRYVGSNHVFISLVHQMMWTFSNNKLVHSTRIISGKPVTPTVTGNFSILSQTRATHLIGADYNVYVEYWMPFYGSYGIHDSRWHYPSRFQNLNSYLTYGSHGCVNVPEWEMPLASKYMWVGTPVTIRQ